MKRNMLAAALFILVGIFTWNNYSHYVVFAVACIVCTYCIWCCLRKNYLAAIIAVFSVCVGFFIVHYAYSEKMTIAKSFEGKEITIFGKVVNCEEHTASSSFDVLHNYKCVDGKERKIKIRVFYSKENYQIHYGDVVQLTSKISLPSKGGGFGDYNSLVSSFTQNILLYANDGEKNITVYENKTDYRNVYDISHKAREFLCDRIEKFYDGDVAGIIEGIIVGVKDNISNDTYEFFQKSGLSHMLVVSGMHVNIIVWLMMGLMNVFGIGKYRFTYLLYIVLIWAFVFISGLGESAIRAAIVSSILFLGNVINREADSLNSLGTAVAIMLFVNPLIYFSFGFRLSVMSTLGILLFKKHIAAKIKFMPSIFRETAAVTISAQLFVIPLLAQSYGNIGVFGVAVNILICPILTFLVALIIISLIVCEIPVVGSVVIFLVKNIVTGIMAIVKFVSSIPYSAINIRDEGNVYLPGYTALLVTLYMYLVNKRKTAKRVLLITVICFFIATANNTFYRYAEITFLHTGNSDCSIMKKGELTIMFDGGGNHMTNVAELEIIPYLNRTGTDVVDAAFITHYHTDHIKGIIELMYAGRIRNVVLPVGIHKDNFEVYKAAKETGTALHFIKSFDKIMFDDIEIEAVNTYDSKQTNNGMVYFITYGKNRVCISGDIHKSGEEILLESKEDISADILKVPHHGSDTSGSEKFIRAVSPKWAVILNGDGEYPSQQSKNLYKKYNVKLYSTYRSGSIKIRLRKNGNSSIYFGRNNFYELRDIKKTN